MITRTEFRIVPELATRPDVAVTVSRELDSYYSWDGDGPDPRDEGFSPYTVTVTVTTIRNGRIYIGESALGGSYFKPDEPMEDVHGYLPDMIAEAIADLDTLLEKGI